jgi:hypothetical protein
LGVLRISISLLGFWAFLIGLAPNIATLIPGNPYYTNTIVVYSMLNEVAVIVFAAGFGVRVSVLSLVTSWVDKSL